MAPAISIQLIILPPKMVPSALVSDGRTISVIVTADSSDDLPGILEVGGVFVDMVSL